MADNRHQAAVFLVGNIPAGYHSSDLRNYFKDFIEKRAFTCFHFKHRPEHERRKQDGDQQPAEGGIRGGISDQAVSDADTPLHGHSPSSTSTATEQSSDLLKSSTCCCVVKVKDSFTREFIEGYHGKRWTDQNGDQMVGHKVRILLLSTSGEGLTESEDNKKGGDALINRSDLQSLPELNPPHLMPHGNVGTPLGVFMDLIRNCKLPSHVIKKLKLNFPISKSNKGYKAVPMQYGGPVSDTNKLTHRDIAKRPSLDQWRANRKDYPPTRKKPRMTPDENNETISKDDDYDAEEWERYEALHEDVDKQGRTSERLFENEMEVVWDKGSSGLVFYTDSSYWDQQDGDFDEKCSKEDDWDVDMSLYYGYSNADRSGVELRQMATERSLREGQSTEEGDEVNQHAWNGGEGFGGKILKQKGWREGSGLGVDGGGISEPLEPEGQHPTCKKGLGYHGERIPTPYNSSGNKGKMKTRDTLISTIYDDPIEEEETPSKRAAPTTLKYRQSHIDKHKDTKHT